MSHRRRHKPEGFDMAMAAATGVAGVVAFLILALVGWIANRLSQKPEAPKLQPRTKPPPPIPVLTDAVVKPKPEPTKPIQPKIRNGRLAFNSAEEFQAWQRQTRRRA